MSDAPAFELTIHPHSDRYDEHGDRWLDETAAFMNELRSEVGPVRKVTTPVEGHKGGAELIIAALGSAGLFKQAVEVFKSWIGRDTTRTIEMSFVLDGKEYSASVGGTAADDETLKEFMTVAVGELQQQLSGDSSPS